ncbi:hypothetical protein AVEN_31048-1 [Araneus ventricosus]|uniref:Uncharacterized protein n=1 Tax=Araneus ventricosus TaxID=182803 RepID=A0A4Y2GHM7_ARAVE|nr:hypothetical protein AVEN_31048-1 [Araneus ventricosus]
MKPPTQPEGHERIPQTAKRTKTEDQQPALSYQGPGFSLVLLMSRFEATQGLFWNRHRNFEPWSDDEGETRVGTPPPNFHVTPTGRRLATTYDLGVYSGTSGWVGISC